MTLPYITKFMLKPFNINRSAAQFQDSIMFIKRSILVWNINTTCRMIAYTKTAFFDLLLQFSCSSAPPSGGFPFRKFPPPFPPFLQFQRAPQQSNTTGSKTGAVNSFACRVLTMLSRIRLAALV